MKNFKKLLSLLCAAALCVTVGVTAAAESAWGDNVIEDHYTIETLKGDVNHDGYLNILDLVRLKKHLAGIVVEIDEAAAELDGDSVITAADLTSLRKLLIEL